MSMEVNVDRLIDEVECRPALYAHGNARRGMANNRQKCWIEIATVLFEEHGIDCENFGDYIRFLKKKWIGLRDQFVKARKAQEKKGKPIGYHHYERLKFLAPYVKYGEGSAACSPPHDRDELPTIEMSSEDEESNSVDITLDDVVREDNFKQGSRTGMRKRQKLDSPIHAPFQETPHLEVGRLPLELTDNPRQKPCTSTTCEQVESIVSATARGLSTILTRNSITPMKKESENDSTGNKAFLMSCLPFLDNLSMEKTLEARSKIMKAIQEVYSVNPISTPEMLVTSGHVTVEDYKPISKWHNPQSK